jgi:hypothetical protein
MEGFKGYRTYTAGLFALVCLVLGLWFVHADRRVDAYTSFSLAVVGIMTTLFAKSVGTSAVNGDGLKGGVKNLMTSEKPGEPPCP